MGMCKTPSLTLGDSHVRLVKPQGRSQLQRSPTYDDADTLFPFFHRRLGTRRFCPSVLALQALSFSTHLSATSPFAPDHLRDNKRLIRPDVSPLSTPAHL